MPRGKRPGIGHELQINPQAVKVQEAVDETALLLLDTIKDALKEKIRTGDFSKLSLTALTKELRGLLFAIKKPASTLNYMVAPAPQSIAVGRRDTAFKEGVAQDRERMLESQKNFLDRNESGR